MNRLKNIMKIDNILKNILKKNTNVTQFSHKRCSITAILVYPLFSSISSNILLINLNKKQKKKKQKTKKIVNYNR